MVSDQGKGFYGVGAHRTGVQKSRVPSKTQEMRQMSKVRVVKANIWGQIRLEGQGSRVSNTVSSW